MKTGISKIGVEIPKYYISIKELAKIRDFPIKKATEGLQVIQARIPYKTDLIDLAVKAVKKVGYQDVERFYFATESEGDASKSETSIKVLKKLKRERAFPIQIKFACLAGVESLISACEYTALTKKPAIVVTVDRSIYARTRPQAEVTQGCGAVAMRIETSPKLLEIDFKNFGIYIQDLDDFKVPFNNFPYPKIDQKLIYIVFLHCIRQAIESWKENNKDFLNKLKEKKLTLLDYFDKIIYHTPFPKITKRIAAVFWHQEKYGKELYPRSKDCLAKPELYLKYKKNIDKIRGLAEFQKFYLEKVKSALNYNPLIGNSYNSSAFIALLGALEKSKKNDKILLSGFGSGAGAITLKLKVLKNGFKSDLKRQIKEGKKLSIKGYEKWRDKYYS